MKQMRPLAVHHEHVMDLLQRAAILRELSQELFEAAAIKLELTHERLLAEVQKHDQ